MLHKHKFHVGDWVSFGTGPHVIVRMNKDHSKCVLAPHDQESETEMTTIRGLRKTRKPVDRPYTFYVNKDELRRISDVMSHLGPVRGRSIGRRANRLLEEICFES